MATVEDVLARIEAELGLPTSWLWLEDAATGRFYSAAARGLPPYLAEPVHMTGEPCWCMQSYQAGELTPRNVGVMACSRLREGGAELTGGLRSHATVPLSCGILNVAAPRGLTAVELTRLAEFGQELDRQLSLMRLQEAASRVARLDERERLARELHDTLAQGLTGALLAVEGGLRVLESRPEVARERLEGALGQLRGQLDEVRGWMVGLRSPLEGQPLALALRAYARAFASRTGIRVSVQVADVSFDERVENELYRIAQEALANVERHSGAGEARLRLGVDGLTVEDRGKGLAGTSGGHGMAGMRERSRAIGARFSARTLPGGGTRVSVRLAGGGG